jgi:bifunctional non-homologous end joining protein LigD
MANTAARGVYSSRRQSLQQTDVMALERYNKKRDFSRTPEPSGTRAKKKSKSMQKSKRALCFVVQKHDASRLHYDFRLEMSGVLASWAVPKGPSLDPNDKRLAVHVEDHPLDYADFEGVIPEGYGAGTVMVWDNGTWEPEDETQDPVKAVDRGKLSFTLHGSKLRGAWTLARMRGGRQNDDGDNWLLIKRKDEHATKGKSVLDAEPTSVKTGRTLEEIAEEEAAPNSKVAERTKRRAKKSVAGQKKRTAKAQVKRLKRGSPATPGPATSKADPSRVAGARKGPMPRHVSPQLCTLAPKAPLGDDWLHEIKFDGYRFLAHKNGNTVTLITRNAKDWTAKFQPVADAINDLPVEKAIIDGEVSITDTQGKTSFQRLQNAVKKREFNSLVFFVFDLLYLNGYDLMNAPLVERKRLLHALIGDDKDSTIHYSDHIPGAGADVYANACKLGLEGIICKKKDAPYTQARSRSWLKVKCSRRQEFVVVGWTPPGGSRKHFGALLLGAYDDGKLVYAGKVGTGFNTASLRDIKQRLDALARTTNPIDVAPSNGELRGAHWVAPKLVAEIEFTEMTHDNRLRHPSFQGLREDKEAKDVHFEVPVNVSDSGGANSSNGSNRKRKKSGTSAARHKDTDTTVAGVRISSPERVLYPEHGTTKLELAQYYEAVSERILPFVVDRPLSTVRCPTGRSGQCFFQKHLGETFDDPVKALPVREKEGKADYISIDSRAGLITLVQFGVLEIHPWGATKYNIEKPDVLTFDLDPGEGVNFAALREGAQRVREKLEELDLACFLKATGGKGLHVVVPLKPDAGWEEAKAFCAAIARHIAGEEPRKYIATMSKSKRRGLIFIDYLRNSRGATSIAPYSTRARAGAPVATPLRWDELGALKSAAAYNIETVLQRLKRMKNDPWVGYAHKQRLTKTRLRGIRE